MNVFLVHVCTTLHDVCVYMYVCVVRSTCGTHVTFSQYHTCTFKPGKL